VINVHKLAWQRYCLFMTLFAVMTAAASAAQASTAENPSAAPDGDAVCSGLGVYIFVECTSQQGSKLPRFADHSCGDEYRPMRTLRRISLRSTGAEHVAYL
jgi:hypothetical protein